MPDELDIMSSMASLDTINANRVTIRRVASLASIEIVHGKRSITRDLVQALTVRNGLLHRVLIVEYLIPAHDWLDTAGETKAAETIIENLIEFERGRRVVRDLNTGGQTVEYPVSAQNRVALRRYQNTRLRVTEYVVLLEYTLTAVEYANTTIAPVEYLIALQRRIGIGFDPNPRHSVIEYLVLLQQA